MGDAIQGLSQFQRLLSKMPDDVRKNAQAIIKAEVQSTAQDLRAAYAAVKTSSDTYTKNNRKSRRRHLADSVRVVTDDRGTSQARAYLRVEAPHASLYEFGTGNLNVNPGPRASGVDRVIPAGKRRKIPHSTGSSAPGGRKHKPTLVPLAERARRKTRAELVKMISEMGFEVTGG